MVEDANYTGYRGIDAQGARIGLLTCKRCGSTVTLDPADKDSATAIHDKWHDEVVGSKTRVR